MDEKNLAGFRNEIFSRARAILHERYGEFVPALLWEDDSKAENAIDTVRRFESFKADADLIDLFDALKKALAGDYGYCLFCREEVELSKLCKNPLAKFCDDCERMLRTCGPSQVQQSHKHMSRS